MGKKFRKEKGDPNHEILSPKKFHARRGKKSQKKERTPFVYQKSRGFGKKRTCHVLGIRGEKREKKKG